MPNDATTNALEIRLRYKEYAFMLLTNADAWNEYLTRCRTVAQAHLYGYREPDLIAAIGLKGFELGMSLMEALAKILMIGDQPTIRGPAAVAHIHQTVPGAKLRFRSSPEEALERAVWTMERPGWEPAEYTFTRAQAEQAGLLNSTEPWRRYPERCMKWQAASVGTQEMFGDVLAGIYLTEEMESAVAVSRESKAPSTEIKVWDTVPRKTPAPAQAERSGGAQATDVLKQLMAWDVSYEEACQALFGYSIDADPDPTQLESLIDHFRELDVLRKQIRNGEHAVMEVHVRQRDYEQFHGYAEVADGVLSFRSPARNTREDAQADAVRYLCLSTVGYPDGVCERVRVADEPDPEVVAREQATRKRLVEEAGEQGPGSQSMNSGSLPGTDKYRLDQKLMMEGWMPIETKPPPDDTPIDTCLVVNGMQTLVQPLMQVAGRWHFLDVARIDTPPTPTHWRKPQGRPRRGTEEPK